MESIIDAYRQIIVYNGKNSPIVFYHSSDRRKTICREVDSGRFISKDNAEKKLESMVLGILQKY